MESDGCHQVNIFEDVKIYLKREVNVAAGLSKGAKSKQITLIFTKMNEKYARKYQLLKKRIKDLIYVSFYQLAIE